MAYMIVFLVCKAILSFLCYQVANPTMYAVAQDHQNDVFSNIVALTCGIIGKQDELLYPRLLIEFFQLPKHLMVQLNLKKSLLLIQ